MSRQFKTNLRNSKKPRPPKPRVPPPKRNLPSKAVPSVQEQTCTIVPPTPVYSAAQDSASLNETDDFVWPAPPPELLSEIRSVHIQRKQTEDAKQRVYQMEPVLTDSQSTQEPVQQSTSTDTPLVQIFQDVNSEDISRAESQEDIPKYDVTNTESVKEEENIIKVNKELETIVETQDVVSLPSQNFPSHPPPAPSVGPPPPPPVVQGTTSLKRRPTKKFPWRKAQAVQSPSNENIWKDSENIASNISLDKTALEEVFAVKNTNAAPTVTSEKDKKVNLLDSKKALGIKVVLHNFKESHEKILEWIKEGDIENLGLENVQNLQKALNKALTTQEEMKRFKEYGNQEDLADEDKFLFNLVNIDEYDFLIQSMIDKGEFQERKVDLKLVLERVENAVEDLRNSKDLKKIFRMILQFGNVLNSGSNLGEATAFKLESLLRIRDVKTNIANMNMMHYLIQELNKKCPEVLNLPDTLQSVKNVSSISIEETRNEFDEMELRVSLLEEKLTDSKFTNLFDSFVREASGDIERFKTKFEGIEKTRMKLAEFFCEDPATFKLKDCFSIMTQFIAEFEQSIKEVEQLRKTQFSRKQ